MQEGELSGEWGRRKERQDGKEGEGGRAVVSASSGEMCREQKQCKKCWDGEG